MTREEEIKARLGYYTVHAEMDLRYLIARNEELQRRVEKMQAVVDAARNLKLTILAKRKPQDYVHTFANCDKTNAVVIALNVFDAKEQDDATS